MAIQRYNPFYNLRKMEHDMFRMFPRNLGTMMPHRGYNATLPVNAFYTDESLVLRASAPGFKPDDVDLTINGNWLVIKGSRDRDDQQYVMKERVLDAFHRAMRLTKGLHAEKAEASFEDGILTITIPKTEDAKPLVHNIDIKS